MIKNKNILATLRTFSNMQKKKKENLYTSETISKAATTEFTSKIPNTKKISLDEIIKSMNFQTNKSPGNDEAEL